MKHTPESLYAELIGSCGDLPEEVENWPIKDLKELDSLMFLCNCCGWWCEPDEQQDVDGEYFCSQCVEDGL